IEIASQPIGSAPPSPNAYQMEGRNSSGSQGIEVLMGNGVSPVHQLLKDFTPTLVPGIQSIDLCPEVNSQAIEVGTKRAGMRIAAVQASIPNQVGAEEHAKLGRYDCKNVIDAFRMKVPTETLKMRRQESGIGVIDLLCGVPSASFRPAYHDV